MSLPDGVTLEDVESSNVKAVGHKDNVLYVQFKNGGLYSYTGVNEALYQQLLNADSVGGFLNQNIKPAYQYEKLA